MRKRIHPTSQRRRQPQGPKNTRRSFRRCQRPLAGNRTSTRIRLRAQKRIRRTRRRKKVRNHNKKIRRHTPRMQLPPSHDWKNIPTGMQTIRKRVQTRKTIRTMHGLKRRNMQNLPQIRSTLQINNIIAVPFLQKLMLHKQEKLLEKRSFL